MKKKKILIEVFLHILFCSIITYLFLNNAVLRPGMFYHMHKECLILGAIFIMIYLHYLFLIPAFFQKGRFALYWAITFGLLLVVVIFELLIAYEWIYEIISRSFLPSEMNHFILSISFLLTMRNVTILLFTFLVRLYRDLATQYLEEQQLLSRHIRTVPVMLSSNKVILLRIQDILYMQYERNYTYIYTIDGKHFTQYISLKRMQEILPKGSFIRFNKNMIIMYHQILSYNEHRIVLHNCKTEEEIVIPILIHNRKKILQILDEHNVRKKINQIYRLKRLNKGNGQYQILGL